MVEGEEIQLAVVSECHVALPVAREVSGFSPQSRLKAMKNNFTGPSYTLGIEEELMILDAETYNLVNAIESLLGDHEAGDIKPELMESVLEIATKPAPNTAEAGDQLRALRAKVRETAGHRGLTIGSARPHPVPTGEDQRVAPGPRHHRHR